MAKVLVVDDEANLAYSMQLALQRAGHECHVTDTLASGLAEIARNPPDVALVDMQLPDGNALDLLRQIAEQRLDVPVVVITAFGTIGTAVAAMKQGAVDFLPKPLSMEQVCLTVDRCLEYRQMRDELDAYREAQQRSSEAIQILGESAAMREALALADRIAALPLATRGPLISTLLLGETGTGKELVARYIHNRSPRARQPFVHINCTAVPENLFESELFGHERGSFTDARGRKKGLFEIAHGGTLFLDEIGDVPPNLQAKLLVAIETGRFRRLGGTTECTVDVRVTAATNSDLERKIERGELRRDLYFRLRAFCIRLPPLRQRENDLRLLTDVFLERYRREFRKPGLRLADATWRAMQVYPWPGNVRELTHALRRAALVSESDAITPDLLGLDRVPVSIAAGADEELRVDFSRGDWTLESVERRLVRAAMKAAEGNVSRAARYLGLSRGGLRNRLEKLGLSLEEPSGH